LSRPPREEEAADGLRELGERERLPPDGVRLRGDRLRLRLADECGRIFRAGDGEPERELIIMIARYSLTRT
jgi:hypothetical protein